MSGLNANLTGNGSTVATESNFDGEAFKLIFGVSFGVSSAAYLLAGLFAYWCSRRKPYAILFPIIFFFLGFVGALCFCATTSALVVLVTANSGQKDFFNNEIYIFLGVVEAAALFIISIFHLPITL